MSKFRIQTVLLVSISFMLGCNEFMVVGILSDLSKAFNVSLSMAGYLVTLFALVYAISTPFITMAISRFNRFKAMFSLLLIFLVGNTFSAVAQSYTQLMISRIMTALTAGVIISLSLAMATNIAPMNKRAFLVSWIFSGFSIASVFGLPIGTMVSTHFGWRYAFWGISVITILVLVLMYFFLPRDIPSVQSKLLDQLVIFKDSRFLFGVVIVFSSAAGAYVVHTFIRPLLTNVLGFSQGSLGLLLFIYGLLSIVSNQFSGWLAGHSGLKKIPWLYISELVIYLGLAAALNVQWLGLLFLMSISFTMSVLGSPIQIHFLNLAEAEYPAALVLASSLQSIFFNFGISSGSAVGGIIAANVGFDYLGYGAGVFALIALIFILLLNRRNKQGAKLK
ncbi:MAG: MFS transporter [Lactobacillus sp.]|nr:MFS transporter [Lactobacillus sp.]